MKLTLPNQPILLSGESRRGLLVRAATANGWALSLLARAIHGSQEIEPRNYLNARAKVIAIGEALQFDEIEMAFLRGGWATRLDDSDLMWNGMRMPATDLRRDLVAACPLCLAEEQTPYLRSSWEHRLTKSCDVHGCLLVERCEVCGIALTFLQSHRLSHCSCGADIRRFTPQPCDVYDSQFVRAAIHNKDHASLSGALDLHDVLSTYFDGQRDRPTASALTNLAIDLYRHPDRIPASLQGDGPERLSIRTLLIHDVPERSSAQMSRALAACSDSDRFHVDGHWAHIFSRDVLTSAAQRILGCTRNQATTFRKSGRLTSSAIDSTDSTRISLGSVNQLLLELQAPPPPENKPSMGKTVRGAGSALASWAKGLIHSAGYDLVKGLSSLHLHAPAQEAEAKTYLAPGFIAADDVARLAGVSPAIFRSLRGTNVQLLWTTGHGGRLGVDSVQATTFLATYRFGGEIARAIGAVATTFSHKLWSHGVIPVSGPLIDGAIGYLFRRSDIAGLDLTTIEANSDYKSSSGRPRPGSAKPAPPDGLIRMNEAAAMLGISRQRFKRLARASSLCSVRVPGIRTALISAQKVRELKREYANPTFISLANAAAEVNETAKQFKRRWIATGIVESSRRLGVWFVTRSGLKEVKRLKSEYDVAAEVSARAGLQRTHFVNRSRVESVGLELTSVGRGNVVLNLVPKARTQREMETVFGPEGWSPTERTPDPTDGPI